MNDAQLGTESRGTREQPPNPCPGRCSITCGLDQAIVRTLYFVFKSYVQQALAEMVVTLKRDRCHCDNCRRAAC